MKVILFGATGMIGQGALRECLLAPDVDAVLSIVRSPTGQQHPKLRELAHADFTDFEPIAPQLAGYDACFFCLGISSSGLSEAEYTRVTHDFPLAAARTLLRQSPGLTFIYVTHDQEEALTMSDRIVVMNKGVIEQDDNPDNIYHYPSTKFVAKFIGESNFFDTETETLALRPEKLNLCEEAESEDKAAAHPEPAFYGTVVDVVFYGTIDKVFVRLDNSNQTVVAYQYFDDVKRWTPDERVGIWWYERDEVKVQR